MQKALTLVTDLLLRPSSITTLEQRASWAATWGLLAALAIAGALLGLLTDPEIRPSGLLWPIALGFFSGCFFALLLGMIALAAALVRIGARMQKRTLAFPWLFLTITWAEVPWVLASFVSLSIGQINWYTRQASHLVDWLGLFWWAALVMIALRSRLGLNSIRTWLSFAPALLVTVGLEVLLGILNTPSVQTAARWRSSVAPNVTLHHLKAADAESLLQESAKRLNELVNLFDVQRPEHKLQVFLFEDAALYHRVMGSEGYCGAAHLEEKFVTVLRTELRETRCTLIHEITHFVVRERLAHTSPGLLQEGIATYAERVLGQCDVDTDPSIFTNGLSLKQLVDDSVFYDGETSTNYAYAGAFVSDIIKERGLPRFKDFCRFISDRMRASWFPDMEEIFLQAFRTIYGIELLDWEEDWKAKRQGLNASPASESRD